MSAVLLRRAASAEYAEWGGDLNARLYPGAVEIHLALAGWLDAIAYHWERVAEQAEDPDDPVDADGQRIGETLDAWAVVIARRILGDDS
ncbi:hypothetical protein [Oerskovia enterophila]|uniref:hypothetical protein n=1 Tax=Oerskovia enterophila TaxID=43678 RepID=UPI0037F64CCF